LERLAEELTGRDLAILGQVSDLKLMSTRQIEAVHFPVIEHDTQAAARRSCQRGLARLHRDGLLLRMERRVGGVRMGSAAFVYGLGPTGHRVLRREGPKPRYHEPTAWFLEHTLGISQLVVDITLAARDGQVDVLTCQPEPRCWRPFWTAGGLLVLRPDLFLALGVGDYERRVFVELDRGHESLPSLLRKCRQYQAYYQSGKEQAEHGVFPLVCWSVPTATRADRLRRAISRESRLTDELFRVMITEDMPAALWREAL